MTPASLEHWADEAALLLDLPLDPAHRPGVIRYLDLAREMAVLTAGLPLDIHAVPAPVFEPVTPGKPRMERDEIR